jgi:hypothetical protein
MLMQLSSFVRVDLGIRPGSSWKKALFYFETLMRPGARFEQGIRRVGAACIDPTGDIATASASSKADDDPVGFRNGLLGTAREEASSAALCGEAAAG